MEKHEQFELIRAWANERGIYDKGDAKTQYVKLAEEFGELGKAILKEDNAEFKDAIGDMVVVLTNLAHLGGTSIEHCIGSAWEEIRNRKGKMENGTFVKDSEENFKLGGEVLYECVASNAQLLSLGFIIGNQYKAAAIKNWPNVYCLINETGQERFVYKSEFIKVE
jgi:NTP pyrophosphatase (non-canonical NTP hydrolase)